MYKFTPETISALSNPRNRRHNALHQNTDDVKPDCRETREQADKGIRKGLNQFERDIGKAGHGGHDARHKPRNNTPASGRECCQIADDSILQNPDKYIQNGLGALHNHRSRRHDTLEQPANEVTPCRNHARQS